jgi:hypothetical protein
MTLRPWKFFRSRKDADYRQKIALISTGERSAAAALLPLPRFLIPSAARNLLSV